MHFALVRNRVVATYDKAGPEERDLEEGRRVPVKKMQCVISTSYTAVKPNEYVRVLSLEPRAVNYVCVICGF